MSSQDTPYGLEDLGPDPQHSCEHCGQRWGLVEAQALGAYCAHGASTPPRAFGDAIRAVTLDDGSSLILIEFEHGVQATIRITAHDAERLRIALGPIGRPMLASRWRP